MIFQNKYNAEQGSAIVWILIAVALFAALNFAFNSGSRTSTSLLTGAEADSYANQILQYGNEVKAAVKRLQLRGCDETEISFENNIVAGYTNPNSPSNKSCHVFDVAGGNLSWKTFSNKNNVIELLIPEGNKIGGVGKDDATGVDLILIFKNIDLNTCLAINSSLNNNFTENPPTEGGTWNKTKFVGSYATSNIIQSTTKGLVNIKSACFTDDASENIFFNVLIAR